MKKLSLVLVVLFFVSIVAYGQSCQNDGSDRVIEGETVPYAPGGKITLKGGASAVGGSIILKPGDGMNGDGDIIMNLPSTSRVGIGTSSPADKLHVNGTIRMNGFKLMSGSPENGDILTYVNGKGEWQSIEGGGGTSYWGGSINGDIYNDNSGNVGIGTDTPNSKLSVGGSGNEYYAIYGEAFGSGGVSIGVYGKGNDCYAHAYGVYGESPDFGVYGQAIGYECYGVYGRGDGDFSYGVYGRATHIGVYGDGGTYDFYAASSSGKSYFAGNVGIGTTDIQSKLTVSGTITADEIEVQSDGLPDFVFEDNYKLMPLSKLEKHIKKEKGLPGIPTNKEAIEKGVKLGDMQAKLLQKVEELTLYVIELNKEVGDLREENTELRQKISSLSK